MTVVVSSAVDGGSDETDGDSDADSDGLAETVAGTDAVTLADGDSVGDTQEIVPPSPHTYDGAAIGSGARKRLVEIPVATASAIVTGKRSLFTMPTRPAETAGKLADCGR